MPTFEGLRVEVQELGAHLHAPGFDEYESSKCVAKGFGVSLHRLLRLPTEVQLQILVCADMTFQWEEANALRIQIDFDEGHEVKDAEIFVIRPVRSSPMNALALTSTLSGDEYTQLSRIARPTKPFTRNVGSGLVELVDAEMVSFKTIKAQCAPSPTTSLHGDGVIRVAVYTCVLEHSARQQAPLGGAGVEKLRNGKMSTKLPLLRHSKIKLFDRVQLASIPHNYRSKKAKLAGSFIFHYHVPDEFDNLKVADEECHCIEDAGPGKRRVVPHSPEPNDIPFPDRSAPPYRASEMANTPEQDPPCAQDHASGHDEDTIGPLTDNSSVDAMDIDEPGLTGSTLDSVSDDLTDADVDIDTDLTGLNDLNCDKGVTATELEFVLDREEAIAAEIEENGSRMRVEYYESRHRIHQIGEEAARAKEEWRERKENAEAGVKRTEEEVERLKAEVTRLEETNKHREDETEKLRADVARIGTLNVELERKQAEVQEEAKQRKEKYDELAQRIADFEEELSIQQRVFEKAEARKQKRLSMVRARDSETT